MINYIYSPASEAMIWGVRPLKALKRSTSFMFHGITTTALLVLTLYIFFQIRIKPFSHTCVA